MAKLFPQCTSRFLFMVFYGLCSWCGVCAQDMVYRLSERAIKVDLQDMMRYSVSLDNAHHDTIAFDLTYWLGWRNTRFFFDNDTVVIDRSGKERTFIPCVFEHDTVILDICSQHRPYSYSNAYIRKHTGQFSVTLPETHELANIILFLADSSRVSAAAAGHGAAYHRQVLNYFARWQNHPIFESLRRYLDQDGQTNFRENSAAYVFAGDNIRLSDTYRGFRARDQFKRFLPLVEDFARQSRFRKFYNGEGDYYSKVANAEKIHSKVASAWRWLERSFARQYESLKVLVSPLNTGWHSTRCYEQGSFNEIIIFVSAPDEKLQASTGDMKTMRRLFTELDHHYVNPISDLCKDAINEAMGKNMSSWNAKGSYGSPLLTFNEYMTWAVFGLFCSELEGPGYAADMQATIDFMEDNRGFVKFGLFYAKLQSLRGQGHAKTIAELYPPMLLWMKTQKEN